MQSTHTFEAVADDELLRRLEALVAGSRHTEADLVAHIGEVDARRLYLREATPSMFVYCTERLHLSETEACLRIAAARAARRHPGIVEMLADGRLHLGAIAKLAPHLTPENRIDVLRRATHRTKREVEELVAEIAPQADVQRRSGSCRPADWSSGRRGSESPGTARWRTRRAGNSVRNRWIRIVWRAWRHARRISGPRATRLVSSSDPKRVPPGPMASLVPRPASCGSGLREPLMSSESPPGNVGVRRHQYAFLPATAYSLHDRLFPGATVCSLHRPPVPWSDRLFPSRIALARGRAHQRL